MFKVSFKDTPKDPSKVVIRMGNKTAVLLKGKVKLPEFFKNIPEEIITWIEGTHLISGEEDIATNTLMLKANGKSVCHEEDKYDYVLGERLAEARAKLKIYKFFYNLCYRLCEYYGKLLYGDGPVVDNDGGLMACMKKYEGLYTREAKHIRELLKDKGNG